MKPKKLKNREEIWLKLQKKRKPNEQIRLEICLKTVHVINLIIKTNEARDFLHASCTRVDEFWFECSKNGGNKTVMVMKFSFFGKNWIIH